MGFETAMIDHPQPDLETVRGLVEQIAKGLQAFHRLEMLHQDLRPENIMIDSAGTVKLIDFGSTRVAGIRIGCFRPPVPRRESSAIRWYSGKPLRSFSP